MRRVFGSALFTMSVAAIAFGAPTVVGHMLFAMGMTGPSARLLAEPGWRGYTLARTGDFVGAANAFGTAPVQAYNRGTALAHARRFVEALDAYDRALYADPEDADARYNREIVKAILDMDRTTPGDAIGSANARANVEGHHGGAGNQAGDTKSTGVGYTGNKEGASTASAQGGSKVAKVGKGNDAPSISRSEIASG